jgi:prevent-host-death family protein
MSDETMMWSVAGAKARFSELIEKAQQEGPQTITRNGRRVAVVISVEEWERRTKPREGLGAFFARSPLRDSGIDLERLAEAPREIEL